jgi:hypothetical protein
MIGKVVHDVIGVRQRLLDQVAHVGVVGCIEQAVPVPSHLHQPRHSQLGEVLRHRRWLSSDVASEVAHRVLPVQQRPQDPQAGVVGEELERLDGQFELGVLGMPDI